MKPKIKALLFILLFIAFLLLPAFIAFFTAGIELNGVKLSFIMRYCIWGFLEIILLGMIIH